MIGKFDILAEQYATEAVIRNRVVAVVPGAFRPPHKEHLAMVKDYVNKSDKVLVFISPDTPSTKQKRTTPKGHYISFSMSKQIWDLYLQAAGLNGKVTTLISPAPSPVRAAYEFVENTENVPYMAQPGEHIILGVSTKGGDAERFQRDLQKHAREGVTVQAVPFNVKIDLHAKDFRKAIDVAFDNNRPDAIKPYIPDNVDPTAVLEILRQK